MLPRRREPFVFVVSGRNVPAGRLRRCVASLAKQKGEPWGAVVFDDASAPMFAEHFESAWHEFRQRCTIVRNRRRRGLLANMVTAIRLMCAEPDTVIVTLDADDALIGDDVLLRLASEYARGADVTVGSMLRTDKPADYPVRFDQPREHRGGNVWQHLRSFRKRLFDAIRTTCCGWTANTSTLPSTGPTCCQSSRWQGIPYTSPKPSYLHEPSGTGKDADGKLLRDEVIAHIVAKAPASLKGMER